MRLLWLRVTGMLRHAVGLWVASQVDGLYVAAVDLAMRERR